MKDDVTKKLLATLKEHIPAKLRAYNGEDDVRDIAIPQRRRRWAQVIAAVEARPWSRVEMLDKSGAVLVYVDNDGPSREVEELGPSYSGVGGQMLLGERIAALALKCSAQAVASRDDEMKTMMGAMGDVVREMSSAVKALGEVYREQAAAEQDAAEARVAAAAEASGGDLKQLLEALPVLMQALPILKSLVAGSDAPPNGARRSST